MQINDETPTDASDPAPANRLRRSRISIVFVAVVFGLVAAMSIFGFFFNLTINYPGTDRPVLAVDPLWMLGHLVRGVGLGWLSIALFRYQSQLRRWVGLDDYVSDSFIAAHNAAWSAGAIVLAVLIVYAIAYVFGAPRIR
jgi:hypothetical protein